MFCPIFCRRSRRQLKLVKMAFLIGSLLMFSAVANAAILWKHTGAILICDNGAGKDILHGAISPKNSNSTGTLYFRFRIDPISDSASKSIADYEAGFVFYENGQEHFGMGNERGAWAYSAMNVVKSAKGYVDLNSATPERGFRWEYIRAGTPKYIAFKVEYIPGQDARITAWLNPNLSLSATEFNQPSEIVTRFEGDATFDEIRLVHRGGNGGGWKFSQMVAATSFEDLLLPHFWQQWWFIVLAMVGAMIAVITGVQLMERRRIRNQIQQLENERAVATERTRIARDIHDELGASLTKIYKLAEIMEHDSKTDHKQRKFPQTISQTARETIQTMDEIVWAINPKNDTLKEMADYLVYFTEDFLAPTGVACSLEVPLNLPDIPIMAETRHNLFMAVKEALNNAIKHGAPKHIKLELETTEGKLTVTVEDDGKGFNLEEVAGIGNGLENMRKRLNNVGGQLWLDSQPGRGTTVKLEVLLAEAKVLA